MTDYKLDWLDVAEMYSSPEVILLSKSDIQMLSGWSEKDVNLLFLDREFPLQEIGYKTFVEIHALIQFFAEKDAEKRYHNMMADF